LILLARDAGDRPKMAVVPTKPIFLPGDLCTMPRHYVFAPQDSQQGRQAASGQSGEEFLDKSIEF
jgi:hypothetical protein